MYSDLLDVLGGGGTAGATSGGAASSDNNKHVATSFKAGKMNLEPRDGNKFWVTPDTRRGTVQLVWTSGSLKWEWKSRRNNDEIVDSFDVTRGATFERIESPTGRIFLLSEPRTMYWMQDASDEQDDDVCVQVNQYLANPEEAKPPSEEAQGGDAALAQALQNSTTTAASPQVDALSNILENLGMPQQQQASSSTSTAAAPTGTLTLADLQGAMMMSGLAAPAAASMGPPLQEVVTPQAISSLLEDDDVCTRLLQLLPEEQQTKQHLEDNLRSPQVQQTLRSLTAALSPDDAGSIEGYHSVLANFSLDPTDGQATLASSGNPIQAFLDCVLASVENEETKEETKEEETKEDAMEE